MPFFDPERGELVLRIVYDGPATAGKSENLKALASALADRTHGELVLFEQTSTGRTLYFDWLEIRTGYIDDLPLRCQVVTVPGQLAHAERRFLLLSEADAVVFVCESTPAGVRAAKVSLDFQRAALTLAGKSATPVVVQANKQDLTNALSLDELRVALGLEPAVELHGASAKHRDAIAPTFLGALRSARDAVRNRVAQGAIENLPRPQSPSQLRDLLNLENNTHHHAAAEALEAVLAKLRH